MALIAHHYTLNQQEGIFLAATSSLLEDIEIFIDLTGIKIEPNKDYFLFRKDQKWQVREFNRDTELTKEQRKAMSDGFHQRFLDDQKRDTRLDHNFLKQKIVHL